MWYWYVIGFWAVCVIGVVIALLRAPEGYEDELTGFHYGEAKR